jgi:hypothetical protein
MCCCGAHIPSGDVSLTSPSDRGREFPSAGARSSLPARACLCETNDRPTTANQTTTTPPLADTTLLQLQRRKQSSTTTHSSKERRGSRETVALCFPFSFPFLSSALLTHSFVPGGHNPQRELPATPSVPDDCGQMSYASLVHSQTCSEALFAMASSHHPSLSLGPLPRGRQPYCSWERLRKRRGWW